MTEKQQTPSFEASVRVLRRHFEYVTVESPVAGAWEEIQEDGLKVPSALRAYLEFCDGIRVFTSWEPSGVLLGSEEMEAWQGHQTDPDARETTMLPIHSHSNSMGVEDDVILCAGPLAGVVCTRDLLMSPQGIVASNLHSYVHHWSTHLIAEYDAKGESCASGKRWNKDSWLRENDPAVFGLRDLASNLGFDAWISG